VILKCDFDFTGLVAKKRGWVRVRIRPLFLFWSVIYRSIVQKIVYFGKAAPFVP
jgi:hypothetical protein